MININEYKSQKDLILAHLEKYNTISTLEAIQKYKILRLGSVINLLRKDDYNIKTIMEINKEHKTRYARYILHKSN